MAQRYKVTIKTKYHEHIYKGLYDELLPDRLVGDFYYLLLGMGYTQESIIKALLEIADLEKENNG